MDLHTFLNRARQLHCLDSVPGLTGERLRAFHENPIRFLIRADDATGRAIWAAVEAEQARVAAWIAAKPA
jgi:hypothetical protein